MSNFKEIDTKDFPLNPFELKDKWMLISAQHNGKTNTMTASWGSFGIMWNKEVVFVVIRPQRYTKEFVDNANTFSLSFFDQSHQKDLTYLGKVSGRDEDKIAKVGLTTKSIDGTPYFEEAELVIFAKKLYMQPMGAEFFLDNEPKDRWYPLKDYHFLYVGEIIKTLTKEK